MAFSFHALHEAAHEWYGRHAQRFLAMDPLLRYVWNLVVQVSFSVSAVLAACCRGSFRSGALPGVAALRQPPERPGPDVVRIHVRHVLSCDRLRHLSWELELRVEHVVRLQIQKLG